MDHAQQRTDRELAADFESWIELVSCRSVHPDLASLAALPTANNDCTAGTVNVALWERERFAD